MTPGTSSVPIPPTPDLNDQFLAFTLGQLCCHTLTGPFITAYRLASTNRRRADFNTAIASMAVHRSSAIAQPNTGTQLPAC
jgi:hypothetical protein